jgi:hypothetical protein
VPGDAPGRRAAKALPARAPVQPGAEVAPRAEARRCRRLRPARRGEGCKGGSPGIPGDGPAGAGPIS